MAGHAGLARTHPLAAYARGAAGRAVEVAVDHRTSFHPDVQGSPASDVNFGAVYAPDTTQNNPNMPGLFHFWLKRGFDTGGYPDGGYVIEVEASDVRGNPSTANLAVTLVNARQNV
jgi:hypothetical protein